MNMIFRPFVVFVLVLAMHTAAAETQATTTVFVNVTLVHPERDEIVTGQTIIVEGERIQSVTANEMAKLPADARIIDATGQFLSPGLVEMHAHVPEARMGQEFLEDMLFLWVANGITTIRNMSGEPDHLALRAKLAQHEVLGPRMYTYVPSVTFTCPPKTPYNAAGRACTVGDNMRSINGAPSTSFV